MVRTKEMPVTIMTDKYLADSERIAKHLIDMADTLKKEDGVCLIFLHKSVDGDCVGSACGLCVALRRIGVEAYVAMPEELPENMGFLGIDHLLFDVTADTDAIKAFKENGTVFDKKFSWAVAVDISESERMGACGEYFDKCPNKIIIDHHASVSTRADNMWIDGFYSSEAETDTSIRFPAGRYLWVLSNPSSTAGVWHYSEKANGVSTIAYENGNQINGSFYMITQEPGSSIYWDCPTYQHSNDGGKTWSTERIALLPTQGSRDELSACDPYPYAGRLHLQRTGISV